jgi:hypothetical protein
MNLLVVMAPDVDEQWMPRILAHQHAASHLRARSAWDSLHILGPPESLGDGYEQFVSSTDRGSH